jgi:hypothetical protein
MKVLAEYRLSSANGIEFFHEERRVSELPKIGEVINLSGKQLTCVEQVGSYIYNAKKQIYQYTFNCEVVKNYPSRKSARLTRRTNLLML